MASRGTWSSCATCVCGTWPISGRTLGRTNCPARECRGEELLGNVKVQARVAGLKDERTRRAHKNSRRMLPRRGPGLLGRGDPGLFPGARLTLSEERQRRGIFFLALELQSEHNREGARRD